jgi:hypothetical protein
VAEAPTDRERGIGEEIRRARTRFLWYNDEHISKALPWKRMGASSPNTVATPFGL